MEVKINIESNQIGDTVIDLFKNLTPEKKEELALSVLKEWLQAPDFFETKNKETLLVEEFRDGKRRPYWSSEKYNHETSEHKIKSDTNFQNAIKDYKNSKQIMMEEIKKEIVQHYMKYVEEELKQNEIVNKIKEDTFNELIDKFPEIISKVLIETFSQNLVGLKDMIINNYHKSSMLEAQINMVRQGR